MAAVGWGLKVEILGLSSTNPPAAHLHADTRQQRHDCKKPLQYLATSSRIFDQTMPGPKQTKRLSKFTQNCVQFSRENHGQLSASVLGCKTEVPGIPRK